MCIRDRLLEVNRVVINEHLGRTTGGKVSFTHLIAWAVVQALGAVPELNSSFVPEIGDTATPGVIRHEHVGLGIAIDYERSDGGRSLFVPCVKAVSYTHLDVYKRQAVDPVARADRVDVLVPARRVGGNRQGGEDLVVKAVLADQ